MYVFACRGVVIRSSAIVARYLSARIEMQRKRETISARTLNYFRRRSRVRGMFGNETANVFLAVTWIALNAARAFDCADAACRVRDDQSPASHVRHLVRGYAMRARLTGPVSVHAGASGADPQACAEIQSRFRVRHHRPHPATLHQLTASRDPAIRREPAEE